MNRGKPAQPGQGLQLCFLKNTDHLCQQSFEQGLGAGGQRADGVTGRHAPIPEERDTGTPPGKLLHQVC